MPNLLISPHPNRRFGANLQRLWHFFDDVAQGFVAADDVSRDFFGMGALLPPMPQCLP